jgi:hypothetical protein
MKLMNKLECAHILGCLVEDVDSVMGRYGVKPMGSRNGRGGGYLPLIAPSIAEFEKKTRDLEAELLVLIAEALKNPVSLSFTLAGVRKDIASSEAPQTVEEAYLAHIAGR